MKTLNLLSTKIAQPPHKFLILGLILFSGLGFLDAGYLTAKHFLASPVTCSILGGCEIVTTSQYATLLGIPVALLGTLYYLTILVGTIFFLDTKKEYILGVIARITITGFIFSLYLTFLQFFVIKALCVYCLFSALNSTLLFITGILIIFKKGYSLGRKGKTAPPAE